MENRILRPLPTDPARKKRRQAALPRNSRIGCQETRAGAEPGNFWAGDNPPPSPSVMRQRLRYRGAPGAVGTAPPEAPLRGGEGWGDAGRTPLARRLLTHAAHRREFLWRGFRQFSIYFCTNLGTNPPPTQFQRLLGRKEPAGILSSLTGPVCFRGIKPAVFASFGGNSVRREKRSPPSPCTSPGCAASEPFLHHFRPPNRIFLAWERGLAWLRWKLQMENGSRALQSAQTPPQPQALPGPTGLGGWPPIPPCQDKPALPARAPFPHRIWRLHE